MIRRLLYPLQSIWREESNRGQRAWRVFLFPAWQIWKRIVRLPIKKKLFNGATIVAHPDCDISSAVIYNRIPDTRDILFLRQHVKNGTLLDIGSNVGSVTLLLSDVIQHAVLFEPNPLAAIRARANLALNQLLFEVKEVAISDRTGEIEFEDCGGTSSCNRTVVGFSSSNPTRRVPCMKLDDFIAANLTPFAVSAVKIDVEGHENNVICGALNFLRQQRPRLIMFEYLRRTNLEETFRLFASVGYIPFCLTPLGPQLASLQVEPLQNLFACPQEIINQFVMSAHPKLIATSLVV